MVTGEHAELRNADTGWYPRLAWELALNFELAAGQYGTVGEITERIRATAERLAREIERSK